MQVRVGASLFDLWNRSGARSLFVVGIGKSVGKTVAMRAIYRASTEAGEICALTSIGRDGEAFDVTDALAKPRLWLEPGTVIATAREALPRSPASELLASTSYRTAAGSLVYARVRSGAHYELIGPPTASALRHVVHDLLRYAPRVLVDGAVDRIAALAGGEDAVIVACGASGASTPGEVVDETRALVARLCTPRLDEEAESLKIEGALTPAMAAQFIRARERRAIVVRDPTQIALTGKTALQAFERLTIRCTRPLHVIAVTVASIGRDRAFAPRDFARLVAQAVALPVFDVYAAERAA
ncbi:MAG TPA: hypothetical protein VMA98_05380 [Candidatus Acidoferrales bacterium]|nr:hypothetical protein [Candidatus Acidoferrales bacterium]